MFRDIQAENPPGGQGGRFVFVLSPAAAPSALLENAVGGLPRIGCCADVQEIKVCVSGWLGNCPAAAGSDSTPSLTPPTTPTPTFRSAQTAPCRCATAALAECSCCCCPSRRRTPWRRRSGMMMRRLLSWTRLWTYWSARPPSCCSRWGTERERKGRGWVLRGSMWHVGGACG